MNVLALSSDLLTSYNAIVGVDVRRALIVKRFFDDMFLNLSNVYTHLKENGIYMIVIGNSTTRNCTIESWKVLRDLSRTIGYSYVGHFGYIIQNPYIRIPRKHNGGEIKEDYILILRKG